MEHHRRFGPLVCRRRAWPRSSSDAATDVTIVEPALSIAKDVSDPTPAPGDDFTYHVDVSATDGLDVSAAYDVRIVDTIPAGVVVAAGTVGGGGVLSDADAHGGGTITWTLPGPIGPGETRSLSYDAALAASSTVDDTALTNTADIEQYAGLPPAGAATPAQTPRPPSPPCSRMSP